MEDQVRVELGERSYTVTVSDAEWAACARELRRLVSARHALLVTDQNVARHYLPAFRQALFDADFVVLTKSLPPGEGSKSMHTAGELYDLLVDSQADRRTLVVALGGGVTSDLAGFVAATYARGVPFAIVPTTLLAMVDASVGGKVAVDHPRAKNMIGAFHQPALVWCRPAVLQTLPERDFRCGLAEVVKHGYILAPAYLDRLEAEADAVLARDLSALAWVIAGSVRLKAGVVSQDERETTGLRSILNYGHTFGHAIEVAAGYRELEHGEAVSIGLCCAAEVGVALGRVGGDYLTRMETLLARLGLPTRIPARLDPAELLNLMRGDKKATAGGIRLVLPTGVGRVELVGGVDDAVIVAALRARRAA